MPYLTLRQLKAQLDKRPDHLLDEPLLFTLLDAYGTETAYPVELLTESVHPGEQRSLVHDEGSEAYELTHNPDELEDVRLLRRLPPGALLLHFSEMDENQDEQLEWLEQPNPHTPPPCAAPAPLFDAPTPPVA